MDILDGENEDVLRVIGLFNEGKSMQGPLVADFIKRIVYPQDLMDFLKKAGSRIVEFKETDFFNCVRDCEHHTLRVEVVEYLADAVDGRIDHLTKLGILKLVGDSSHRERITTKLKI